MKKDLYTEITNKLIKAIENGSNSWVKSWNSNSSSEYTGGFLPVNISSRNMYRGINIPLLLCEGYSSNIWGTFKQWKDKKCSVKKGEKSTVVIFWKMVRNKNHTAENKEPKSFPLMRTYRVFNSEQVEGFNSDAIAAHDDIQLDKIAQDYIARESISIHYGGNRACYSPKQDFVVVPKPEDFRGENEFYSTLFHELGHSTGHKSRLNRQLTENHLFGSKEYSKEELIAEFTAAFLMAYSGRNDEFSFDNSAAYLRHWSKHLRDNPKWAIQAAQAAQKAMDYIIL
tara:strand:- start:731 stop:1582 length:852 start_codon:yes stop_codon:yes gene_type:complete